MKKLRIFIRACFYDYPYWRVLYKDGDKTRLLYHNEAKELKQTFGGRLIIDYKVLNHK